jgi:4-hydroxybenzoate polyprenyltransferase/phosphoserine phosphatase
LHNRNIFISIRLSAHSRNLRCHLFSKEFVNPITSTIRVPHLAPLVVDLDGTLTATDTLIESLIQVLKKNPISIFPMLFWLTRGRAAFKTWVASHARINAALLPYHAPLVVYLEAEKARGRTIVLATAAHVSIAEQVYAHFPFFDSFISSSGNHNLKGTNKLAAIQQQVGTQFVYAGDSSADLPIWKEAAGAVVVGASRTVTASARKLTVIEMEFPKQRASGKVWLKALRVHQWLKNVLLFVPLATTFSFLSLGNFLPVIAAFIAFSLAASATYIVNDLWDLETDRQHPRKKMRPFASAQIPVIHGLAAAAFLLTAAILLASNISTAFVLFLFLYIVVTSTYSFVLKSYTLLDVMVLSLLYTLRILAGAAALEVPTSQWLLAFSMFVFLSLALVKRCSELIGMRADQRTSSAGRDYHVEDLTVLWPMGVATTACSIVVFGLFIHSPETQARYMTPSILWATAFLLCYWLFRLWIKTARGEMHDDPVVYALIDRGSRLTVAAIGASMLLARFLTIDLTT